MSRYGWENGTLLLPTAEVKKVKTALVSAVNREHEKVYKECQDWCRKYGAKYRAARKSKSFADLYEFGKGYSDETYQVLEETAGKMPKRSEVTPAPANSRTKAFVFSRHSEASVTFNGRSVTWDVVENNHSVEAAHEDKITALFFRTLNSLKWTRGSGGVIHGNNEYNEYGSSGNRDAPYLVAAYGPRGKKENHGVEMRLHDVNRYSYGRSFYSRF